MPISYHAATLLEGAIITVVLSKDISFPFSYTTRYLCLYIFKRWSPAPHSRSHANHHNPTTLIWFLFYRALSIQSSPLPWWRRLIPARKHIFSKCPTATDLINIRLKTTYILRENYLFPFILKRICSHVKVFLVIILACYLVATFSLFSSLICVTFSLLFYNSWLH